jgi:hypothetical protein
MGNCVDKPSLKTKYNGRKFFLTKSQMKMLKTMGDLITILGIELAACKRMELCNSGEPIFLYSTFRIASFYIYSVTGMSQVIEIKALYRKNAHW